MGALGPLVGEGCFRDFCETVDGPRKYSMIHIDYENQNAEINLISNYDGPFNFTVGAYQYKSKNDNETNIATGASSFLMDLGTHPYFPTLNFLSGGAPIGGKGGAAYYQEIGTWIGTGSAAGWTHPATLAALSAALTYIKVSGHMLHILWKLFLLQE